MRRVDLNLLYVLRELLKEPSTTKVAAKLHVTQSSVSASLRRLRWAFDDELFIRSGSTMVPTRKAMSLLEPVEDLIQQIEAIVESVEFDPENLDRSFHLVAADHVSVTLSKELAANDEEGSTAVRLVCAPFAEDTLLRLRSGSIDLVIAPISTIVTRQVTNIVVEPLYEDRLVLAAHKAHPLAQRGAVSEEEFIQASHISHTPSSQAGGWRSTVQRYYSAQETPVENCIEFPNMISLLHAMRGTEFVAILPESCVRLCGDALGIVALETPTEPQSFSVEMAWGKSLDRDSEHQWFRSRVKEAANRLFAHNNL